MNFFFRPNASRGEKLLTIVFAVLIGLAIYGLHSGFVADQSVVSVSAYLAAPIATFFIVLLARDQHPKNKVASYSPIKKTLVLSVTLVCCYGLIWSGLAFGSTSIVTYAFGEQTVENLIVSGKGNGRFHWGRYGSCRYAIYLRSQTSDWHTRVCTDHDLWEHLNSGDIVTSK